MKINQNENEIILTDTPILFWIIGAFFSLVCAITFIILVVSAYFKPHHFFSINPNKLGDSAYSIIFFGAVLLFLLAFFFIFAAMMFASKIKIYVDSQKKIVEVTKEGILKNQSERYYFSQIRRFESFSATNRELPELVLILSNNSKVHLKIRHQSPEEFAQIIQNLNSFIIK